MRQQEWAVDDDDLIEQMDTSTVAVMFLFGTITFCTVSMAARTWLLGDNRAILTWITSFSMPKHDIICPLDQQSFVSIFVLLFNATLFGLILFAAYILEHHPPFPHEERTSAFDADYLVFLVLLLLLYAWMTCQQNKGHSKEGSAVKTEGKLFHNNSSNISYVGGGQSVKSTTSSQGGSVEEIDFQDNNDPSVKSRGGCSRKSGKSVSILDILDEDTTIATPPSIASSTTTIKTTKTEGLYGTSGARSTTHQSRQQDCAAASWNSGDGRTLEDILLDEKQESSSSRCCSPSIKQQPSKKPPNQTDKNNVHTKNNSHDVLNVNQSLEWKGVLSACFLIYQLTAAELHHHKDDDDNNDDINIYSNAQRWGASCFVFLTGFGHARYFYDKNDYRLVRVLRILFRINVGTFWLCLTLGRPYICYYASVLHSLAFLLVYGTMRIRHSELNYTKYGLRIKMLGLAVIIFLVWDVNFGLFQILNLPFFTRGPPMVGAEHGPLWEWYYQSHMHHWAVFVGMVFAVNYPITNLLVSRIESMEIQQVVLIKGIVGLALACAFGLWISGPFMSVRYAFDSTNPYLSLFPILCYVYFRNITKSLRERHMTGFKSLGALSLELYLLHHHFFLSSDGTTVLVLIPGYPKCNMLLLGILLLYTARLLHKLTAIITEMILPMNDEGACIRSVVLLGGSAGGFYGTAYALRAMGLINMGVIATIIIICGFLVYHTIMATTWQEYRKVGLPVATQNTSSSSSADESPVAKASPPLIGAMVILFLGVSWHLLALVGATSTSRTLPMSCETYVNDGIWAPVSPCTAFQRGIETREYKNGGYYSACDEEATILQWGWNTTAPGSHCRFHYRNAEELQRKLNNRTLIFIGDSMVQKLFHAICRAMGDVEAGAFDGTVPQDVDITKNIGGARLEYQWAPLAADQVTKVKNLTVKGNKMSGESQPDILIIGGGLFDRLHVWTTVEGQEAHKAEVSKLAKEMQSIEDLDIRTIWCTPTAINTRALRNETKNQINELAMSETRNLYAALGVESSASFVLDGPSYSRGRVAESYDGVNYPLSVYNAGAQIVANAFDWLLLDNRIASDEPFSAPSPGAMNNPFLGMMMICFGIIGLFFFDGYLGFAYVAYLWVLLGRSWRSGGGMNSDIIPNVVYEEAFGQYISKLKLTSVRSNGRTGVSGGHRPSRATARQSREKIQDDEILSLLVSKSGSSELSLTRRRSRSPYENHDDQG